MNTLLPVLSDQKLPLNELLALDAHLDCGGLALFAGTIRDANDGKQVLRLSYSAFKPMAERIIREIQAQALKDFNVRYCRVMHRIGLLELGDLAIVCVVRSAHRAEAFAACKHVVDTVKHTVPIFKEEFYADGSSAFVQGCCIRPSDDDDPLPVFLQANLKPDTQRQLICTPAEIAKLNLEK